MKTSEKIKKSLYRAAAFFTVAVFALSILFYLTDGTVTLTVTPSNLAQIFAFCLIVSFSFLLFNGRRNVWLSAFFQLLALTVGFTAVFLLFGSHAETSRQGFILVMTVAAVYAVIALPILIFVTVRARKAAENADYKRQYR